MVGRAGSEFVKLSAAPANEWATKLANKILGDSKTKVLGVIDSYTTFPSVITSILTKNQTTSESLDEADKEEILDLIQGSGT